MKYRYSQPFQDYSPALYLDIKISPMDLDKWQSIKGKIDTGADISVLPESWKNLFPGIEPVGEMQIIGVMGNEIRLPTYFFNVKIGEKFQGQIETTFVKKENYFLIGRDILKNFQLIANGPRQEFELNN